MFRHDPTVHSCRVLGRLVSRLINHLSTIAVGYLPQPEAGFERGKP
jgi:hypothetical protein